MTKGCLSIIYCSFRYFYLYLYMFIFVLVLSNINIYKYKSIGRINKYRLVLYACQVEMVQKVCSPLVRLGMENGMLMTPTRSSIGIRDLKMALIRIASPLPAWIS